MFLRQQTPGKVTLQMPGQTNHREKKKNQQAQEVFCGAQEKETSLDSVVEHCRPARGQALLDSAQHTFITVKQKTSAKAFREEGGLLIGPGRVGNSFIMSVIKGLRQTASGSNDF